MQNSPKSYKIDMLKNSLENNSGLPYAVKNVLENPKLSGVYNIIGNLKFVKLIIDNK